jgi:FlaA1/EpsC-like NDP-sugar epimerase
MGRPNHQDRGLIRRYVGSMAVVRRVQPVPRAHRLPAPAMVRRVLLLSGADLVCWAVGLTVASVLRLDFQVDEVVRWGQVAIVPLAALCLVPAGLLFGLYTGRWRYGSFEEMAALARVTAVTTPVLLAVDRFATQPYLVPLSSVVGGGVIAFVLMGGLRYLWRMTTDSRRRPNGEHVQRVIVFGAGEGGAQAVSAMLTDKASPLLPVAILDDDPKKSHLRIRHIPVVGDRTALAAAAAAYDATAVLLAIPGADRQLVAELTEAAAAADLTLKVLPSVRELDGRVAIRDIRDIQPTDLLGRREVATSVLDVAGYIAGRRVLVTGAGGSIGSELCRQLVGFGPSELLMLDRDESALHAVTLSMDGRALLDSPNLLLADLRDEERIGHLMRTRRPEVIFHAAALKHLPLLERNPGEGVKTNVRGTELLLELACEIGVEHFINISTDKAADPTSVLGYTKRLAERLTAHHARRTGAAYLSVRFGNVLGSRGSVLEAFAKQIAAGGPITVTDPEVTRYFMTVGEAVQLVVQAGAVGKPGEVLVLDMGEPVRIADVARLLIRQARADVEIEYTGLRPGEKMSEIRFAADEVDVRPSHPLISQCDVPPLHPSALDVLQGVHGTEETIAALQRLCQVKDPVTTLVA